MESEVFETREYEAELVVKFVAKARLTRNGGGNGGSYKAAAFATTRRSDARSRVGYGWLSGTRGGTLWSECRTMSGGVPDGYGS